MGDELTTPSEQAVAEDISTPASGLSEQGQKVASTATADTATPAPEVKEDPNEVLKRLREQARRELDSEYGKRHAEAIRQERERAAFEREQMLDRLGQYVPDNELQAYKQNIQSQSVMAELQQLRTEKQYREAQTAFMERKAKYDQVIADAGLTWDKLPPEVVGTSEAGFSERLLEYTAPLVRQAREAGEKRAKAAAEAAERDTEKRLGVPIVGGAAPSGAGGSTPQELSKRIAAAYKAGNRTEAERLREELRRVAGA